jgi:hypothetical protein
MLGWKHALIESLMIQTNESADHANVQVSDTSVDDVYRR